jgi:hypothetical protein
MSDLKRSAMSKENQIYALLTGSGYAYATKALGVSHMAHRSYGEVFSVTRADIDAYVDMNGIPMDGVLTSDDAREGIHFVRQEDRWTIYWAERGQRYSEEFFTSEVQARAALVTCLLRSSGTGLDFSKKP